MAITAGIGFRASGTIAPRRAVAIYAGGFKQVTQATANQQCFGVAQEGQLGTPGLAGSDTTVAANDGQPLEVVPPGSVAAAEAGAAVTAGQRVKADANGRLVPCLASSGVNEVVGFAITGATVLGATFSLYVFPHQATL